MTEVIGNLQKLGIANYSNIDITFTLVNRFGKPISLQDELMIVSQNSTTTSTTDANGNFTVNLLANGLINRKTYYKVTIADTNFDIYICENETKVDILCLINEIDYDGILTISDNLTGEIFQFDANFIQKINSYMLNKSMYIKRNEKKMIDKFLSIADIPADSRSEDIKQLDTYLATIGV